VREGTGAGTGLEEGVPPGNGTGGRWI